MSKKDPNKKGLFSEFVAFINKGNALAMAVGVILGGAFTAIVTAINKNIISPLIAWAIGDTNLSESVVTVLKYKDAAEADVSAGLAENVGDQIPDIVISWGSLIQAVIDFLLIAIILFIEPCLSPLAISILLISLSDSSNSKTLFRPSIWSDKLSFPLLFIFNSLFFI